jgi:pseudomonalisin
MGRFGTCVRFILMTGLALAIAAARAAAVDDPATLLAGNHPDEAADFTGEAAAAPSQALAMRLTMALRNRDELAQLLADQQDPASPDYHRWMTPDEFTSRFGPTDADLARVTLWLTQKGFTVESADAATREVSFTGTVAHAQAAFSVRIAATAAGAFANITDPAVPVDLAPLIESIHGLDNMLHSMPSVHRIANRGSNAESPAAIVDGRGPAFGPADIYAFYDEIPLLNLNIDGRNGGCLAVIEDSNIDLPAADAFNSQFALPTLTPANFGIVLADSTDPGLNADQDEAMVDVNYAHAIAPGSSIRFYLGNPKRTPLALIDAIHAAINDRNNRCTAISFSFSFCGGSSSFFKTQDGFFKQAAAQGQSVFISSGDDGAAGLELNKQQTRCVPGTSAHVNELSASPNVTAIGGTQFTPDFGLDGNDVGFVPEIVWDDGSGATGGGESKFFKNPGFQKGLIKKDKNRDVPDISFAASPSSPGFFFGGRSSGTPIADCCIGGTSVGAPVWAGISQLISQKNGAPVGNLNKRIYQLGAKVNPATTGIRDVTAGSNGFNGVKGSSAGPGYDKASGWGTVDMDVFVPAYLGP